MILKQKHTQKENVRSNNSEIPRPILDIAFTGYSYGAKRGQIRNISDHNYIIPLYDYGVGTYDFDLDKVKVLVDLAQHKAEIAVKEYFANNEKSK